MFGARLRKANEIARKRYERTYRYWDGTWPYFLKNPPKEPVGRFRKWNGSCSCPGCRGPRYNSKGLSKRIRHELLCAGLTDGMK